MKRLWRLFFRVVVGIGIVFSAFSLLVVVGMNRVKQSSGYTNNPTEAATATLAQSLPKTAANIYYSRCSKGMGGRLLIYRFSAPVADLKLHASAEFGAHWDKPLPKITPNSASPFTFKDVAIIHSIYQIDADWILPPSDAIGTVYESADGQRSHRPTIFVDETNQVLYFWMTD